MDSTPDPDEEYPFDLNHNPEEWFWRASRLLPVEPILEDSCDDEGLLGTYEEDA